jgi:hypothetical protein
MAERPREALLLFAQQLELDVCTEAIRALTSVRFRAERAGVGPREARQRTHHLLSTPPLPSAVLVLGSAAWLLPTTVPEMAIWARELRAESGPTLRPSLRISARDLEAMGFMQARLVTTVRPVRDAERAAELADKLGGELVDQEAHAIVDACVDHEVECAVLRVVTGRATLQGMPESRAGLETAMRRLAAAAVPLLGWLERREEKRLSRSTND